ncbi:MAG: phosphotransferase [Pseudomonadota bacterium]
MSLEKGNQQYRAAAPVDDVALASRICSDHWGLEGQLSPLGAELDTIYRLDTASGTFVLRLSHAALSYEAVDLQLETAAYAAQHVSSLSIARPIVARTGELLIPVELESGEFSHASLSTWVKGSLMVDTERTPAQLRDFGAKLAELNAALAPFEHPEAEHYMRWDLLRCSDVASCLSAVQVVEDRRLVAAAIERFENHTLPRLNELPFQIIHADATPYNVLVSAHNRNDISGVIDFGDVVRTARVCDVAIAASYLMGQDDRALDMPALFVGAFHAVRPLQEDEIQLIPYLIEARHAMTAAITLEHASRRPENAKAITKNTRTALLGLRSLSKRPFEFWSDRLHGAISGDLAHA